VRKAIEGLRIKHTKELLNHGSIERFEMADYLNEKLHNAHSLLNEGEDYR
jgi:hypothetical protein